MGLFGVNWGYDGNAAMQHDFPNGEPSININGFQYSWWSLGCVHSFLHYQQSACQKREELKTLPKVDGPANGGNSGASLF